MGKIKHFLSKSKLLKKVHSDYLFYKTKRLYQKDPKLAADELFFRVFKKHINWENPQMLEEKISWLQHFSDTTLWTKCADKYRVREYVSDCGLEEYLPKLYGHWDNVDAIDFDKLPNQFVIKANNGSGTVKVVRDKSRLDIARLKKEMKQWLKVVYGYQGGQSHYLRIKPCILAEELLIQSENEKSFSPNSLVDYKVWCVGGKPEYIWVAYNRKGDHVGMALFDREWNEHPEYLVSIDHYTYYPNVKIEKPKCLEQMLKMAETLNKPFGELRADFYIVNDKPIIGELTLSAGYGFFSVEFEKLLGSKIDLSKYKKLNQI